GRQAARGGDGHRDDRTHRRGLTNFVIARSAATKQSRRPEDPGTRLGHVPMNAAAPGQAKAGTVILVGCGQMGSAMLRGWLTRGAAERFFVVEPAGAPAALAEAAGVTAYRAAGELPAAVAPDAVVFAVKPQLIDAVVPAYRPWVRPQTLFLSIAAGTTI